MIITILQYLEVFLNYLKDYTKIFNEFCKISNCIIVDRTSFDLEKKLN